MTIGMTGVYFDHLHMRLRAKLMMKMLGDKRANHRAAHILCVLNKKAKGGYSTTKGAVYGLKRHVIHKLYLKGYCTSISLERQTLDCWHTHDYNFGRTDYCVKCDNTDVYKEHLLYSFIFGFNAVCGMANTYKWHLPIGLVDVDKSIKRQYVESDVFNDNVTEYDSTLNHDNHSCITKIVKCKNARFRMPQLVIENKAVLDMPYKLQLVYLAEWLKWKDDNDYPSVTGYYVTFRKAIMWDIKSIIERLSYIISKVSGHDDYEDMPF